MWRPGGQASKAVVAVLPFEDFGPDAGRDHFGDGPTEDVIAEIGRWRPEALGVIARDAALANVEELSDWNFAAARKGFERALALNPSHAEALPEMRQALEGDPGSPFYVAKAGRVAAAAGRRDEAVALLGRLEALSRQRPFVSRELAMLLLAVGRREEALGRLEQAHQAREPAIRQLPWDPDFSALADAPRFQDLKSRIERQIRL